MNRFVSWVKADSALIFYGAQAALAAIVAFGISPGPGWTAAVVTVTSGLITIATAFAARPVRIPVITGAAATIATASAAFGLHLSGQQTGAAVPVLSVVLALLLREHVRPAPPAAPKAPGRT